VTPRSGQPGSPGGAGTPIGSNGAHPATGSLEELAWLRVAWSTLANLFRCSKDDLGVLDRVRDQPLGLLSRWGPSGLGWELLPVTSGETRGLAQRTIRGQPSVDKA
jgi:hypothetical protein